jgi:hypothetical protein
MLLYYKRAAVLSLQVRLITARDSVDRACPEAASHIERRHGVATWQIRRSWTLLRAQSCPCVDGGYRRDVQPSHDRNHETRHQPG